MDIAPNPSALVPIDSLRQHPRNYRQHPPDQLAHLVESVRRFGFYRNIVVARDGTILAGHGVVAAARQLGVTEVPVIRLDLDPESPAALKVLTGDNELGKLAEFDDRALTEILKGIKDEDLNGLLGTGFDPESLAALVMVTRPESEVRDKDNAAQWVGMPVYEQTTNPIKVVVSFADEAARQDFAAKLGIVLAPTKATEPASIWWPPREKEDLIALRFK